MIEAKEGEYVDYRSEDGHNSTDSTEYFLRCLFRPEVLHSSTLIS